MRPVCHVLFATVLTPRWPNSLFTLRESPIPAPEGEDRARSATERFFYRRLESLPETTGRFQLNVPLPIPFDGWGNMEVDLLCAGFAACWFVTGRWSTSVKHGRISSRSPQGHLVAGTRLLRPTFFGRRPGRTTGLGAGRGSPGTALPDAVPVQCPTDLADMECSFI